MANGHGIEDEPIYGGQPVDASGIDPSEAIADRTLEYTDTHHEIAQHSVFDEPGYTISADQDQPRLIDRPWHCLNCDYNLQGCHVGQPCPECGHIQYDRPIRHGELGYASWLQYKAAQVSAIQSWLFLAVLAFVSGPLAIVGTLWQTVQVQSGLDVFGLLGVIMIAPMIEEIMKVLAIALVAELKPYWVCTPGQIVICAALSGLGFAVIENAMYLLVYINHPTPAIIAWRWSVCVALHVGCSTIVGTGVANVWQRTMLTAQRPQVPFQLNRLTLAIIIHASYNALATLLELAGVFQ
ncbi:MAG: hypothetical protein CMJ19_21170 [Phycisphaeraceae bacterium]|nr:hypothetical protein [Phycisphaeraceae bacterium]